MIAVISRCIPDDGLPASGSSSQPHECPRLCRAVARQCFGARPRAQGHAGRRAGQRPRGAGQGRRVVPGIAPGGVLVP